MPQAVAVGIFKFIGAIAVNYIVGGIAKHLGPKPKQEGRAQHHGGEIAVNYTSTEQRVQFVYGQCRIGGMDTIPGWTPQLTNQLLIRVLTLGFGRFEEIGDSYVNDVKLSNSWFIPGTAASSRYVLSTALHSAGTIPASIHLAYGLSRYQIAKFLGTTSHQPLIQAGLSSYFLGYNTAWVYNAYSLLPDRSNYPGLPVQTFSVKGMWLYDPRLDSTRSGGAGTHRLNDPSSWSYSDNTALAAAHHLTHWAAGAYDDDEIDWSTVIAAANHCDATVYTPTGTAKRYTVAGLLYSPTTPEELVDNIKKLADAMLGRIIYTCGVWKMYAGVWSTPTVTIDSKDWITKPIVELEGGAKKRFNSLMSWYNSSSKNFTRSSYLRSNSVYATEDFGRVQRAVELPLCVLDFEAARKTEALLRQSRNQILVAGTLPPRFSDLGMHETVTVVDSSRQWYSKTFRMTGAVLNEDGTQSVALQEEQSTDWTDIGTADYTAVSTADIPETNSFNPSAPTDFTVIPNINGTIMFGLYKPIVSPLGTVLQIIRSTNSADAGVGTVVWQGDATQVPLVMPTSVHWYYSRATVGDRYGPYYPNTFGLVARSGAEATQRYSGQPVQDPDVEYSAEMGEYWIPSSGFTSNWSLSITGGNAFGKIILTVPTPLNEEISLMAFGRAPFSRIKTGSVRSNLIARVASYATNSYGTPMVDYLNIDLNGWTGASSPVNNINALSLGVGVTMHVSSHAATPSFGQTVGQWREHTQINSIYLNTNSPGLGYINPTSYPMALGRLVFYSNSFTGVIEIERAELFYN